MSKPKPKPRPVPVPVPRLIPTVREDRPPHRGALPGEAPMLLEAVLRFLPSVLLPTRSRVLRPPPDLADLALAPGQSTLLRLVRGTVVHVHAGEAFVEDAPRLWADHAWPQARRLRAGEAWVVPRTGWWRLDGLAARGGPCQISARPPAAPRSRPRRPC